MTNARITQLSGLLASQSNVPTHVSQLVVMEAFGPLASRDVNDTQHIGLISYSAGTNNVTTQVTQAAALIAYATGEPNTARQDAWTFILDGHRFYVLPLGPEGDWAYDVTTKEWCQLQSDGFNGLNFTRGVMWGLRVMGGDALYPYLYELDPTQSYDEEWRPIKHIVTGGVPLRGRYSVGVSNFTITASVNDVQMIGEPISLQFSDDNGETWSPTLDIPLTDISTQKLIWNSLGSFSNPGRVFMVTDTAGPVRIDGADVVLTGGDGLQDSGQEQEG